MIAMQYSFTFPADYDMNIIRERVRTRGNFLDQHEPLLFKAYLISERDDQLTNGKENRYAPFYLWKDTVGMTGFIMGSGFKAVVGSFGEAMVQHWPSIIHAHLGEKIQKAKFATREKLQIDAYTDFTKLSNYENSLAEQRINDHALSVVAAFEPGNWSLIRFCLWENLPDNKIFAGAIEVYQVLHVSNPSPTYHQNGQSVKI